MKNAITLLLLIASLPVFSQNRYSKISTSSYSPRNLNEIMAVPMALQARYNENQKFLYGLKKWILELKTEIKEEPFLGRLIGEYEVLTSLEDEDLARATKRLNQIEIETSEIISDYNKFISEKSIRKQAQNSQQGNQSIEVKSFFDEGVIDYSNKNFSTAIVKFTKHLDTNPNDTNTLYARALAKSKVEDNYGAISDYDKIISLGGSSEIEIYKFSTIYNNKAYCLVKLGHFKDALALVEKALSLDESEWYIWDTRAEIFLNLGQLDKCIADCNKAISIEPNSNSYYVRGLARIKKGEKTKGCQDLSKAGELGENKAYDKINEICNKK
jgi:tetratricopeptide (TPR) repeat protein